MVGGDEDGTVADEAFPVFYAEAKDGAVGGAEGHPAEPVDPAHLPAIGLFFEEVGGGFLREWKVFAAQDFGGGISDALNGELGCIEDVGIVRDFEWCDFAGAIGGIACGYGVDFSVVGSTVVADGGLCIDVDFVGGFGEDDGADIAAFHDYVGAFEVVSLEFHEFCADFRYGGDGGDVLVDGGGAEVGGGIYAIDGDGRQVAVIAAGDFHFVEGADDGWGVGGVDAELEDFPGDGAVHGAGVDHDEVETLGKVAGECAFSRGGGAIDGDRVVGHGERVGSMKSAGSVFSERMASRWWAKPG